MARNGYLEQLRSIPAFERCSRRELELLARLVDLVELPAGTVQLDGRQLIITLDSVRALVVHRRALPAVLDIAPDLATEQPPETAWRAGRATRALRLHPA